MLGNLEKITNIAPCVTPFITTNLGKIVLDTDSQNLHISRLVLNHMAIFLGSNAGEARQMDIDNLKKSIICGIESAKKTNSNTAVLVGVIRENLDETIELSKFSQSHGADAIVITPGYTKGNPYGIRNVILKSTSLPIFIYNNPEFQNKKNLSQKFIKNSAKDPRVIGIKDTSRNPEYFSNLLRMRNENFGVFQGDTKAGLSSSIYNCDGLVAIEANLFPESLVKLWQENNNKSLRTTLDFYSDNKKEYGGSIRLTKVMLENIGIFQTSYMYNELNYYGFPTLRRR